MNRELKFRCFDTLGPKMYTGHSLSISASGSIAFLDDTGNWIEPEDGRIKVMQFTGLHDLNWKEIYESDIVKDARGRIWLIKWAQSVARFVFELIQHGNKKFNGRLGVPTRTTLQAYLTAQDEVTGNIYEHPHLLSTQEVKGEK